MTEAPNDGREKVLQFKLHKEPGTVELKREAWDACEHRQLILDVEGRLIQCKACKALLDPWKALKTIQRWFGERDYKWERIKEWEKEQQEKRRRQEERRRSASSSPSPPTPSTTS